MSDWHGGERRNQPRRKSGYLLAVLVVLAEWGLRQVSVARLLGALIGAAIADGHIRALEDPITRYLPQLAGTAYEGVTVRHLLTHSSGLKPWRAFHEVLLERERKSGPALRNLADLGEDDIEGGVHAA